MANSHTITLEEVERVAKLARLSLTHERAQALQKDLAHILELVSMLDELDTSGIEATAHPLSPRTALREDVLTESCPRDEVLARAPASRDGGFSVPKVLEVEG